MRNGNYLIGIVTPTFRLFRIFIVNNKNNFKPNVEFKWVSRIDDIRGIQFDDILNGIKHEEVDKDVIEQAKLRIVKC